MRRQYHFRESPEGLLAWDVHRLIKLTEGLPVVLIPLDVIAEMEENYWFDGVSNRPTCRQVANHAKLIAECDLRYPIILCSQGRVMDGMHRICKAYLQGETHISAHQFTVDPEPDHIGKQPDELDYSEP